MFAPRNVVTVAIREQGSDPGSCPGSQGRDAIGGWNCSVEILARRSDRGRPRKALLADIWSGYLTASRGRGARRLIPTSDPRRGVTWRLSHERFDFVPASEGHRTLPMRRVQPTVVADIADVCPTYGCSGTLVEVEDLTELREDHYARLLPRPRVRSGCRSRSTPPNGRPRKPARIQDAFMRGEINVLSCSTTFELGVDVGDIEAVFLRNVPPTPANYVQRAGRAGRRTDAAALVVTFAQRRSHDLSVLR